MRVKELIKLVNEEGANIYQLSIEQGFSKSTLRGRLLSLGYTFDKMTGKFVYGGDPENEPLEQIITYVTMQRRPSQIAKHQESLAKEEADLFSAIIQLPAESGVVTFSFKTDKTLVDRLKAFIKDVALPSGKVCSLAIYEFLEKYEPIIEDLKNGKK